MKKIILKDNLLCWKSIKIKKKYKSFFENNLEIDKKKYIRYVYFSEKSFYILRIYNIYE